MRTTTIVGLISCFVTMSFSSMGMAAFIRPDKLTSPRIEKIGAKQQEFKAVGKILRTESSTAYGSAVMLSSTIGVTSKQLLFQSDQFFAIGQSISRIARWASEEQTNADLAVFELESPISEAIVFPNLYRSSDEIGRNMTYLGYSLGGNTGQRTSPIKFQNTFDAYGLRRHGGRFNDTNMLAIDLDLKRKDRKLSTGKVAKPINLGGGKRKPRNLEGILSFGERGGGAFIKENGDWALAGIGSFYDNTETGNVPNEAGDTATFTRISQFDDWIDGYLAGGGSWKYDPTPLLSLSSEESMPVETVVTLPADMLVLGTPNSEPARLNTDDFREHAVPEPSTVLLLVLGALVLGLSKRCQPEI